MDLKNLFSDEDAVSPVIGVILMVAITVILAAVIGTFVLGLGDQVQSSAPNANFQFSYGDETFSDGGDITLRTVTITHNGGQDVESDSVNVQVGGGDLVSIDGTDASSEPFGTGNTLSTGSSTTGHAVSDGAFTVGTDDPLTSGDSTVTTDNPELQTGLSAISGGQTVRVVWESSSGGSSNTIGQSTVPN